MYTGKDGLDSKSNSFTLVDDAMNPLAVLSTMSAKDKAHWMKALDMMFAATDATKTDGMATKK